MDIKKYEKNEKLFLLYVLFTGKLFVGTTQVLFLTFKGFSFTQIMLISTITGICSLLFEIPSGMIADKIGYKKCICIGLLLNIIGYVYILCSCSFSYIIIYSFLTAVGGSIISGADYSLLYESLKIQGKESKFADIIRKNNSVKMYFVAIVTVFSGILYEINEYLPFLCTILLYVIALIISLFFHDVPKEEEKVQVIDYFNLSVRAIRNNKKLKMLIISGSIFTILFMNQNVLLQQYMIDIKFPISLFGIVFFGYNLLTGFVSKRSGALEEKFGKNTKVVFTMLIVICFIMAAILKNWLGIIILALCRISVATINPIMDAQVNNNIDSKNRATLLSFYNAINSLTDAIFSPLIGLGIDKIGVFNTYFVFGLIGILFVFYLWIEKIKMYERR